MRQSRNRAQRSPSNALTDRHRLCSPALRRIGSPPKFQTCEDKPCQLSANLGPNHTNTPLIFQHFDILNFLFHPRRSFILVLPAWQFLAHRATPADEILLLLDLSCRDLNFLHTTFFFTVPGYPRWYSAPRSLIESQRHHQWMNRHLSLLS